MMWFSLVLILCVATFTNGAVKGAHKLRSKLFENYDKLIRPVRNDKTVTPLHIGITPLAITELDEDKQILEMDTWVFMKWKDEYLVWNPEEYDGVTTFNIPSTEIWRPDVTIYSGTPSKQMGIEVLTNAIVNYTGDVLWVPPVTIRSRCPHEVPSHQLETQTCIIRLGSWTYHEYNLNIQELKDQVRTEHFKNNNPKWDLLSFTTERLSKYYSCCKEPYPEVDFKVSLKRKPDTKPSHSSKSTQQQDTHEPRQNCYVTPRSGCNSGCHGNVFTML